MTATPNVDDIRYRRSNVAPNAHPLIHFIWKEINEQRTSQELVAFRAGVCSNTIRKWRRANRNPAMLQVEAVLNVLGYDLCVRRSDDAGHKMGHVIKVKADE